MPIDEDEWKKNSKRFDRIFGLAVGGILAVWAFAALLGISVLAAIIIGIIWLVRHM